ncbi:hypothetical protein LMH87_010482 [Akanthomyces muscarius]|uniref:Carboxylesterase type B domain-containing protein n=1 Tax=Akanthomyces muscarius TaxID=2231603 RepID=A0A9W8UM17_AKAMU|nr:hypothetical protein LMH87_010482 [Akanthomyces muscarius]KAJ4154018.1 hypothetical protein LMH87_010482 [Akanthomyces muscarius]
MRLTTVALAALPFSALAAPQIPSPPIPSPGEIPVDVPGGTVIGAVTGVESFHGIPFADPPPRTSFVCGHREGCSAAPSTFNATVFAPGCPQIPPNTTEVLLPKLLGKGMMPPHWPEDVIKGREDCLTVTVQRPKGTQAGARLSVLFFILAAASCFGFLGGAEVLADDRANLGLRDQRMGLEWVADNIASVGGDPDRVAIWDQLAGSISAFDQMAL